MKILAKALSFFGLVVTALVTVNLQPSAAQVGPCIQSSSGKIDVTLGQSVTGVVTQEGNITYKWDWGDKTPVQTYKQGQLRKHEYKKEGTYSAKIVSATGTVPATDGSGNVPCKNGTIAGPVYVVSEGLVAKISAVATAKDTFKFSAAGSTPSDKITTYQWDFGDGATSGARDVTHKFWRAKPYAVILTVGGSGGKTATATKNVYLPATPGDKGASTGTRDDDSLPKGAIGAAIVIAAGGAAAYIAARKKVRTKATAMRIEQNEKGVREQAKIKDGIVYDVTPFVDTTVEGTKKAVTDQVLDKVLPGKDIADQADRFGKRQKQIADEIQKEKAQKIKEKADAEYGGDEEMAEYDEASRGYHADRAEKPVKDTVKNVGTRGAEKSGVEINDTDPKK